MLPRAGKRISVQLPRAIGGSHFLLTTVIVTRDGGRGSYGGLVAGGSMC